jgi:sigma-B regulation protein RsbU (phosphoserine phosphatase)
MAPRRTGAPGRDIDIDSSPLSPARAPNLTELGARLRAFLLDTWPGRVFLAAIVVRLLVFVLETAGRTSVLIDASRRLTTLVILGFAVFYGVRTLMAVQRRLLWRVRRKLVVSYILIGLVPVMLIAALFLFAGWMLMMNVSAYLLLQSLDRRMTDAAIVADSIVSEVEEEGAAASARRILARRQQNLERRYAGMSTALLTLEPDGSAKMRAAAGEWDHGPAPDRIPAWVIRERRYVEKMPYLDEAVGGPAKLVARAVAFSTKSSPAFCLIVDVPIDQHEKDRIRDELGLRVGDVSPPAGGSDARNTAVRVESPGTAGLWTYASLARWVNIFNSRDWNTGATTTVSVDFVARPLELYRRVASGQALGDQLTFAEALLYVLLIVGILFLIIETVAFIMGFSLARSITGSIHQLFAGTQRIQQGDFTHRIDVNARDQLGELAESFNSMTRSIDHLLRQQAEKRRLEEELRIARDIQTSLLPRGPLRVPGVTLAALCVPAREVGGDYYDFFPLGDERVGMLIADVAGKGTSAALYMAELKGLMLSLSQVYQSPKQLLVEVNRIISENLDARSFITMTYAVLDIKRQTMTYARAGHTPLIYLPAGQQAPAAQVLAPGGLVLGLRIDGIAAKFESLLEESTLTLGPGDVCVLFTDGITEAMNIEADLFGEKRLCRVVEQHGHLPSEELRERILREVEDWVGFADQHDDMTMILIKMEAGAHRTALVGAASETAVVSATPGA